MDLFYNTTCERHNEGDRRICPICNHFITTDNAISKGCDSSYHAECKHCYNLIQRGIITKAKAKSTKKVFYDVLIRKRQRERWPNRVKTCVVCLSKYSGRRSNKYCSDECSAKAQREYGAKLRRTKQLERQLKIDPITCSFCDKVFLPSRECQKYCSSECKKKASSKRKGRAYRERKKEQRLANQFFQALAMAGAVK